MVGRGRAIHHRPDPAIRHRDRLPAESSPAHRTMGAGTSARRIRAMECGWCGKEATLPAAADTAGDSISAASGWTVDAELILPSGDNRSSFSKERPPTKRRPFSFYLLFLRCLFQIAVWIEHIFFRRAFIKVGVALGSIVKTDDSCVDDFGNRQAVVKDRLHKLAVELQHGRMAGVEVQRPRPALADADFQDALLRLFVRRAGIFYDVEAR